MADEESGISDSQLMAEISERDAQVTKLLGKKDKINALKVSLSNPPIAAKSIDVKNSNAAVIEKVLATVTENDISSIVDGLDIDSLDILMKYVYRFMASSTNCSLMLKLHASIAEKAGVGSIIRVLTDRKQV